MKKNNLFRLLALTGGFLFAFLFWQEKWGINTLLYSIFLFGVFWRQKGISNISGLVLIPAFGTLLSSILIVVHNSDYSKAAWICSLILWMGYNQEKAVKSFFSAWILAMANFFEAPFLIFVNNGEKRKTSAWKAFWKKISLFIIPIGLLIIFFSIYYVANPKFAALYDRISWSFQKALAFDINMAFIATLLLGIMLFGGIFFTSGLNNFYFLRDENKTEKLVRKRRKSKNPFSNTDLVSLKKEYKIGVLVLGLLNLQLAVVNLLDIGYVWFSFKERSAVELSQFVHDGTTLLILAILLAMAVIVWFFRGNINFFPKNKFIKLLVHAWIIQNVLLTLSVGIRNFHYIRSYGLAYNRIGVFFFLILVLYGLWTVKEKVRDPKTFYYLLQKNAWFFYFTLIAFSGVNWHTAITKYNLSMENERGIDAHFLIYGVPDQNVYLLLKNKDILLKERIMDRDKFINGIDLKMKIFLNRQRSYSWKSFNFPDWKNKRYLKD